MRLLPLARGPVTEQIQAMKKIIKPAVREEYELVCDVTGKPAVAKLVLWFDYYGGVRDSELLWVDLCEEVAEDILKLLQSKYPQIQTEKGSTPMHCPLCRRGP
jgi:hypothetical protein